MGEARRIVLGAGALFCACTLCLAIAWANDAFVRAVYDHASSQEQEPQGSVEGLPVGQGLDQDPNSVVDGVAVFDDRAVKLFQTDAATLETCVSAQVDLFESVPESVDRCLAIAPTRAAFETSLKDISQDELDAIEAAYSSMPGNVACADVATALQEHADEYLYYRTHSALTYYGAYWAARSIAESLAAPLPDIADYTADERRAFTGSLGSLVGVAFPDDRAPVYFMDAVPNSALIAAREDGGVLGELFEAPTVAVSRGSYYAALGSRVGFAVVEGGARNGRALMLVGDSDARLLTPWLASSFDTVVYVSQEWNTFDPEGFQSLFSEYGVTDFLLFQSISSLSLGNGNSSLLDLAGE